MTDAGPLLAATLRLQALEGHGPSCLGCATARREAAELDCADRERELREAEAAAGRHAAELARATDEARAARRARQAHAFGLGGRGGAA